MRGRYRNQPDFLAVHMDRYGRVIGQNRQRGLGRRSAWCTAGGGGRVHQAIAQLRPRQDGRTQLREILVAAGMIRVNVGVYQEANRTIRNLADRGGNLLAQGRELGVHHEYPVRTGQHADGTALALQGVEIAADLRGFDLNLTKIGLALRAS
jgi:hypothetical protein